MQTACIEFARNECGLKDADSTEFDTDTPYPVIFKLRDLVGVEELGGTMRLGAWDCLLSEGSLAREVYGGASEIKERHRHRYEFNPEFRETLVRAGLRISGESPDGKFVEMVELPRQVHPWFLGCQFHPEYKSKPLQAHPLFASFVRAAFENRMRNENSMGKTEAGETLIHDHERAGVAGDD
jgi:CTP synthase